MYDFLRKAILALFVFCLFGNVVQAGDATFSYSQTTYCQTDADPLPILQGSAGIFSSSPATLALDANTGLIDVSASPTDTFVIQHIVTTPCADTAFFTVIIESTTVGEVFYPDTDSAFCFEFGISCPIFINVPGGSFSNATGLDLNLTTGCVDLANSSLGTHEIIYTPPGNCVTPDTVEITISDWCSNTSIAYAADTFCPGDANIFPNIVGPCLPEFLPSPGLAFA
ncbi:MAG: hypothetical protein AAF570_18730, partial [Bacteroidota bacterium]